MDSHGTVLLAVDMKQTVLGHRTADIRYSPYGWRLPSAGLPALGFNGQRGEDVTGTYNLGYGYRMYSPGLKRFHSPDRLSPFGKGGLNSYVYCLGDPINYTDPTGQFVQQVATAIRVLDGLVVNGGRVYSLVFRARPAGILGGAALATNIGYMGASAGMAIAALGYPSGNVIAKVGLTLAATGNIVTAGHRVLQAVRRSRLAAYLPQFLNHNPNQIFRV